MPSDVWSPLKKAIDRRAHSHPHTSLDPLADGPAEPLPSARRPAFELTHCSPDARS